MGRCPGLGMEHQVLHIMAQDQDQNPQTWNRPSVIPVVLFSLHANLASCPCYLPLLSAPSICPCCAAHSVYSIFAPFDQPLKEPFYERLISVFIGRNAEPNAAC